jgi:phosphoribosylanthranilate isomerase
VSRAATSVAVKICGVCSPGDAELAAAAGADYLGVILAPARPRSCTALEAAVIFGAAPLRRVGVFVDASETEVLAAADRLGLDVVQLHGEEPAELVHRIAVACSGAVWKAVRVRAPADIAAAASRYGGSARGLLLDGWAPSADGGAGAAFDWSAAVPARAALPPRLTVIAAGGLRPDNVATAIALLQPHVVDVSSGVESSLRNKSAADIHAFVAAARAATQGGSS